MLNINFSTMDYVIGQMSKMQTNSYAAYVVNRIINLLDDLSLKFVTQQLIRKSDHKIATYHAVLR